MVLRVMAGMIAVVGCGNPARGDDGAGPEIIRLLQQRHAGAAGLRLIDAGTDGMAAMFAARGCRSLIIADACQSGSDAGAIFEVPGHELMCEYSPSLNLHDFRWDHAIHAGRKLFRDGFPSDVTVFLIEAASLEFGVGLSPVIAAAALKVAGCIEAMIAARRAMA